MKPKTTRVRLSFNQKELACQFSDAAVDNPRLDFEEVARKVLGSRPFPQTAVGRKFRNECKAVFDAEWAK